MPFVNRYWQNWGPARNCGREAFLPPHTKPPFPGFRLFFFLHLSPFQIADNAVLHRITPFWAHRIRNVWLQGGLSCQLLLNSVPSIRLLILFRLCFLKEGKSYFCTFLYSPLNIQRLPSLLWVAQFFGFHSGNRVQIVAPLHVASPCVCWEDFEADTLWESPCCFLLLGVPHGDAPPGPGSIAHHTQISTCPH